MGNRRVRLQVLAFIVIAVVGVVYTAVRYVGITRWFGSGYTVHLELAEGGGIFTNAEVTYRGAPIGRVGDMRLTAAGIEVDLHIDSDRRIPSNLVAAVADRSVIGEQYVDLRPRTDSGPYLHDDSTIRQQDTRLPPPVQQLLLSADQFARSVPIGALRGVIDDLDQAVNGRGSDLNTLLRSSRELFDKLQGVLPQTLDLIRTGRTVLATQNADSAAIEQFSANLAVVGRQLVRSDGDLSALLRRTSPALNQVTGLIRDVHGTLGALLTNLYAVSDVVLARKDGLRQLLVGLPVAVKVGGSVITPQGLNVGLVPTFFDPLPCTSGYGGTTVRPGLDTGPGAPLNTSAGCTAPAASGQNVRGTQNAPR